MSLVCMIVDTISKYSRFCDILCLFCTGVVMIAIFTLTSRLDRLNECESKIKIQGLNVQKYLMLKDFNIWN